MSIESDRLGPMTDDEAALFRYPRFGQLPDRVLPTDQVALLEIDPKRDVPEPAADPTGVWSTRYA